ncbi:MAG TPA: EAL domain-containing protein [Xanthobacteraceae bacterium]|nr:EAL domain-containing protein [Xanthobacteraceae bacterium]
MLLRSIRSQLLGLVVATVVPFTALIGIGLAGQWRSDRAEAIERARNEARLLAAEIDDYIGNLENLLTGLSVAVSPSPADAKHNNALLEQVRRELPPIISNILLISLDGTIIGSTLESFNANVADRKYFGQVLAGQRVAIEVIRARTSGRMVVTVARPVEDRSGRLRAVIAIGLLLEHLQDALRVQALPAGSIMSVVDDKGIVIARSTDGAHWIGRDVGDSDMVARHLAAKEISEVAVWPDGVERITGSATSHIVPWQVSVGLPMDVAFAAVAARLGWAALFIFGTLLTAFAIAWMLSGRIVRPLWQLGKDASTLAAGELSHRSAVHTHDEVGALADNFNQMAASLERREDEARCAADELRKAKDTLAAVIDASPVAIVCSDVDRNLVLWSQGAEQIFGYCADEVLGRRTKLIPQGEEAVSQTLFDRAFRGETVRDVQLRRRRKDATLVDVRVAAAPMYNLDGTVRGVAWAYEDITDRKKAEEQLRRLAHYDQLTGLPNRLSLQKELGRLLSGDRRDKPTAIALFDLDGFKDVNDTLGHSTGDEMLMEVGQRLIGVAELRSEVGLVSRLGGDEFVTVFPNCGDPRVVGEIVEAMLKRLSEPYTINDHVLHIDASVGVAIAPNDGANVDELIANADLALYQAKSDGGRVCRFFMPILRAQAQARRGLDIDLRRAFAQNEFELYFQPQVRLADAAVVGAEALLRWRHPHRGVLGPGAFIETLGESSISPEVGRWIIMTACRKAAEWRAMGFPLIRVAANLFPSQAHDEGLVQDVDDALRATGLPPEALELEITEYVAFNYEDPTGPLLKLHEKGVRLAFDDFGTGYASLNYLTRFPVSRIKIDRSFVGKITDNAEDSAIVSSLIAMAHNLELEVIAEGVESAAQAAFLLNEHCEEAQGFLYSEALPAKQFEAYLKRSRLALQVDSAEKPPQRTRNVPHGSPRALGRRGIRRT